MDGKGGRGIAKRRFSIENVLVTISYVLGHFWFLTVFKGKFWNLV